MKPLRVIAPLLVLCACSPASFQPQFKSPVALSEDTVLNTLAAGKARDERPVVVGVTEDPMRLLAFDFESGLLWERPVQMRSAPLIAGDAIVAQEAQGITVRDLKTGDVRTVVDEQGELIGADGEGSAVIVSIAYPNSNPRGAVAYIDGNHVRWKRALPLPAGVPALVGGYALIPWATQRLSVLSLNEGKELTRWHFPHTVIGHALFDHGQLYVGQQGLFRLDAQAIAHAADAPPAYTPLKRSLPGQLPLLRDGYLPIDKPDSAVHRLQVSWRPAEGRSAGEVHAENDQLVLRFYRLLFALDARQDALQWVRTFEHDLIGVAVQPGGSLVVDSAGVLRAIDTAGSTRFTHELGRALRAATIRPGHFRIEGGGAATQTASTEAAANAAAQAQPKVGATSAPSGHATAVQPEAAPVSETPLPSLRAQLVQAAALPDSRLSAGRAYAVELLGRLTDPEVTGELIALCEDHKSPEPVQHAACDQLAARADGSADILVALKRRASFVHNTAAPPVAALAQIAARMQVQQAAPLLVAHLQDPATPAPALAPVIAALEQLNHQPAIEPLERFVRLHHDEPDGSEIAPAVHAALHALGALRARSTRASLQTVVDDGLASTATRQSAGAALAMLDTPAQGAAKSVPENKLDPEAGGTPKQAPVVDTRPYLLDARTVRGTLAPVAKKLSACVVADATMPHVGRISMVIDGRGEVEGIFVTPTTLQACVEPLVRTAKFPETRLGRQRVTYEIRGPNAKVSDKASKSAPKRTPRKGNKTAATQ